MSLTAINTGLLLLALNIALNYIVFLQINHYDKMLDCSLISGFKAIKVLIIIIGVLL